MKEKMIRTPIALLLLACLAACVSQPMYQWGTYESNLFQSYKDPTKVEALRINLEAHTALMESNRQKVAPGLYAELGTLYLQLGSSDKAINMYKKEREAWPESQGLMNSMIQNLERRTKEKAEKPQ
jgi:hypothetical protein